MKFLILRFSSIGDIVLTTPVMRCLKKKFPGAEIHYATKKAFHSIVRNNPYISKVHLLEDSVFELIKDLLLVLISMCLLDLKINLILLLMLLIF